MACGSEDHDTFRIRCLAEFPKNDASAVIPLAWVEAAVERWKAHDREQREGTAIETHTNGHTPDHPANTHSTTDIFAAISDESRSMAEDSGDDVSEDERVSVVGADIASEGVDKTVFALRGGKNGRRVLALRKFNEPDTMKTAARLTALIRKHDCVVNVDVIGIGTGVYNRLRDDDHDDIRALVRAFNAAEGTDEYDSSGEWQFINVRAAAWWHMRELLDPSRPGGSDIELPPDPFLIADLTTPTWTVAGQKYKVESKADIAKRLGRSTDEGDAVVMAFYPLRTETNAAPVNITRKSPYRI
jgi:hypothetical protein